MKKGKLTLVKGDATQPQGLEKDEVAVIPHVCNNLGGWGKGFVLALNKRFGSGPRSVYEQQIKSHRDNEFSLGYTSYYVHREFDELGLEETTTIVANMIAQNGYIDPDINCRPLRYDSLVTCMTGVRHHIIEQQQTELMFSTSCRKYSIHCPKFGSDLAGGNWDFVLELIKDIWIRTGVDVVIYEFEPDKDKWGTIE